MREFCNFVAQNHHMDKKLIIGTLFAVIITIGVTNAEDVDEIGYRYFLVSDVDSMMANGDRLCGPRRKSGISGEVVVLTSAAIYRIMSP